jgi:hypothetical protein
MDDVTKLDQLDKTDPLLEQKTSDLIAKRLIEEKRKAELRQEMKMAKAREDSRNKRAQGESETSRPGFGDSTPPVETPLPIAYPIVPRNQAPETPTTPEMANGGEYITKQRLTEVITGLNKSFAWIEKYVAEQNAINAKVDRFITDLSGIINAYKDKENK